MPNGKQHQEREPAAEIRRGVQGRGGADGHRAGPSEHRGRQGTWDLHRHAPKLAESGRRIRVESFQDDVSNNFIESFNKQFKAWYKTKQGFSSFRSANNLISMFLFFFNFVRPHSALNGLTPAQVAGLNLPKHRKRRFLLVA